MSEVNLADLVTQWSRVLQAGQVEGDTAVAARNELLLRYHEAVLRYLRAELRDDHAADAVYSNFALRVLEADRFLQRADPDRGRFRDYLKTVLKHMVADQYREQQRENRKRDPFSSEHDQASDAPLVDEEDQRFLRCWRQELINKTWEALAQAEKRTDQPYATLLRLQEEQPELRSAQLADQLTQKLGKPFTAVGVRKLVQRGRELFGDLLVSEVARSLQVNLAHPEGADRVESELIDLGMLFSYCKAALERCRQPS